MGIIVLIKIKGSITKINQHGVLTGLQNFPNALISNRTKYHPNDHA